MTDPRTETLRFRVTPDEKRQIEKEAADSEVGLSQYLREAALGEPSPDEEPEDPDPAVDVSKLQYQLTKHSKGHLERFPGDAKSDEDRVFFDGRVRALITEGMPELVAREQAATELFAKPSPVPQYLAVEKLVRAEDPSLSPKQVTAEAKRRVGIV